MLDEIGDLGEDFFEYYNKYYKQCKSLPDKDQRDNCTYCLDESIFSMSFYKGAAEILKNEKLVYDIGANTNVQRFFFEKNGTKFVGIDRYPFPGDKYTEGMIIKEYPFNVEQDACAVSHLCLGFLIPVSETTIKYLKQFKTIIFEYPYIQAQQIELLKKYFDVSRIKCGLENKIIKLDRKTSSDAC